MLWNKDFYVPREKKPALALQDQNKHSSGPWAAAPSWPEFRGGLLGNTQRSRRAKALSSGCFQPHITDTLWSLVMVSVPDRAVLIKGWLMGRKGNLSPTCLFPLDYGCIFSVAEKYLGSCPERGFCGLGLGKDNSWKHLKKIANACCCYELLFIATWVHLRCSSVSISSGKPP